MANQQNPQKPETPGNAQKQQNQSPSERDRQNQQQQGNPSRQPGQNQDAERQRQQSQGNPDRDMVGRDTDGDGKVVKPGQKPGQSHGTGIKPDQKR